MYCYKSGANKKAALPYQRRRHVVQTLPVLLNFLITEDGFWLCDVLCLNVHPPPPTLSPLLHPSLCFYLPQQFGPNWLNKQLWF